MSFLIKYIEDFNELVLGTKDLEDQLNEFKNCLVSASSNGKKSIIVGNGGSAAIASHFAVDLTKNAKTRCINFNESDLITCFANDYGYENWVKRAIDFYGDEGDVLVAISSSGSSENILNGCREARVKKFSTSNWTRTVISTNTRVSIYLQSMVGSKFNCPVSC